MQPGTGWQTPFPASLCPHQEPRDPLWQGCPRPSASCLHVGQGLGPTGASRAQPTGEGGDEQQSPTQTRVRRPLYPPSVVRAGVGGAGGHSVQSPASMDSRDGIYSPFHTHGRGPV